MGQMINRRRVMGDSIELYGALKGRFSTSLLVGTPVAGKHHFLFTVESPTTWQSLLWSASSFTNSGYIVQREGSYYNIRFNCGTEDKWGGIISYKEKNVFDVTFTNGTILVHKGNSIFDYTTVETKSSFTSYPTIPIANLTVSGIVWLLQYDTFDLDGNMIHSIVPSKNGNSVGLYDLITHKFEKCGGTLGDVSDSVFEYFGFNRNK